MKITLTQTGGLVNLPACVVDSASLPPGEADKLRRLLQAVRDPSARLHGTAIARDGLTYRIRIEDGGTSEGLEQSDAAMSSPFADLVAWLRERG